MKMNNQYTLPYLNGKIPFLEAQAFLNFLAILLPCLIMLCPFTKAQDNDPNWAEKVSLSVENMILSKDLQAMDQVLNAYVDTDLRPRSEWKDILMAIRQEMHDLDGSAGLTMDQEGLILSLANRDRQRQLRIVLNHEKKKISQLVLLEPSEELEISWQNLQEVFDHLEQEGMSGIIYIKKRDEIVMQRPFGMADRNTGRKNRLETVFGTGSRPIDYTVAAIQLLDQQGKLKISDPITKYIDDVPEDKKTMTLEHLMTGRSGLPDFFDNESDWDPDLAWVSREEAIRRMMSQQLLFEPGQGRAHSHGAFGLLAAIVEIVSGQDYYGFIREQFLDPAGMNRTGEYGESRGLQVEDFAVGSGPQKIGLPNIPPNWGPTSWLVKGSGGMYSALADLLKFYEYIRSGEVLDDQHSRSFRQASANFDGSMRGFELFSLYEPGKGELFLFSNEIVSPAKFRTLIRALERLLTNR